MSDDMPGSGPPEPDTAPRLAEVIAALRAGTNPGVKISAAVSRALLGAVVSRNEIHLGGYLHFLYEIGGVAFLSPPVT